MRAMSSMKLHERAARASRPYRRLVSCCVRSRRRRVLLLLLLLLLMMLCEICLPEFNLLHWSDKCRSRRFCVSDVSVS